MKKLFVKEAVPPPIVKKDSTPPPIQAGQQSAEADKSESKTVRDQPSEKKKNTSGKKKIGLIIGVLVIIIVILYVPNKINSNNPGSDYSDDSYQDRIQSVEEMERENPLDFLYAEGSYRENFLGDKIKIDCEVSNSATVTTYKDVVLEFTYYTKSDTKLGVERETIYDNFPPGSTKSFRLKIPNYSDMSSIDCRVKDAVAK